MNLIFIIVSAGQGKRFGLNYNKLLYPVNNKPLLYYLLYKLQKIGSVSEILLTVNSTDKKKIESLVREYNFTKVKAIIKGGKERSDSVFNALHWIKNNINKPNLTVAIHDGARINCSEKLIRRLITGLKDHNGIIPVSRVTDTIKEVHDQTVIKTIPRNNIFQVQTPQLFRFKILYQAYRKAKEKKFNGTDDAAYLEFLGYPVKCIEGENKNIKLTYMEDINKIFQSEYRTGTGIDIHPFAPRRALILGGIKIKYKYGLEGHSDADVLIHAVMDSLLGAAGLKDIGHYFPNTDKQYKNISSCLLLKKVKNLLEENGFSIVNIDSTLLAEEPKISPYIDRIKKRLAQVLQISEDRISVKATSTEKMGFIGRKEGIVAQSISLLRHFQISQ